jgi:O-antigen ligase
MEALARNRQSPTGLVFALWGGGALLAVAFGVASAASVTAVAGLLAVLAASAVLAAALTATRWALIVLLFLLYSYAGWVAAHAVGAPEISVALLLIIIAVLAWRQLTRTDEFSLPSELIAVLMLGFTFAASAAFAADLGVSLRNIWDFIGYALTVVAIVALLDRPVWLRRAVWTLVVAGGALAIISLVQAGTGAYESDFAGFAIAKPEGAGVFRVGGPLDPNYFGQVLVVTAILALYLGLCARGRPSGVLALAMFAACVAATGLTGSRGALVAAAAAFCLILLLAPIPRGLVAATLALVATAGLLFLPSGLKARVGLPTSAADSMQAATVEKGSEAAMRGRESENRVGLAMFRDHPVLGVGPGNYPGHYLEYSPKIGLDPRLEAREPHNLYLGALAETGIIGGCAFLTVLGLALRGAWRGRHWLRGNDALLAEGIFVALVSFLVAGLFLHAAYPRYLWIMVGLGFAAGQLARNQAPAGELGMRLAGDGTTGRLAAAEPQLVTPHSNRGGRRPAPAPVIPWATLIAGAACVAIILIVIGGGNDKNTAGPTSTAPMSVALTPSESPTTPAQSPPATTPAQSPPATTPAQTGPPAEPAGRPTPRTARCDPIIGSGTANSGMSYPVTSFARDGNLANCAKAKSVLLSALNGGRTTIGKWRCTTRPTGPTIATCTSVGGRTIQARG